MKKIILSFLFLFASLGHSFGSDIISQALMKEWTTFRTKVDMIEPEGEIGGYMLYREFGDMTLLWRTSSMGADNEVIRFFMQRPNGVIFAVTYHKSDVIVPGKVVLRRFVGNEPTGWINHTIDFTTGKYLGSQGHEPLLLKEERKMMKVWGIQEF